MIRNRIIGLVVAVLGFGGVVGASGVALAQEFDDGGGADSPAFVDDTGYDGGGYDGGGYGPMDPDTFDGYMDSVQNNSDAAIDAVEAWDESVIRGDGE